MFVTNDLLPSVLCYLEPVEVLALERTSKAFQAALVQHTYSSLHLQILKNAAKENKMGIPYTMKLEDTYYQELIAIYSAMPHAIRKKYMAYFTLCKLEYDTFVFANGFAMDVSYNVRPHVIVNIRGACHLLGFSICSVLDAQMAPRAPNEWNICALHERLGYYQLEVFPFAWVLECLLRAVERVENFDYYCVVAEATRNNALPAWYKPKEMVLEKPPPQVEKPQVPTNKCVVS